MLFMRGITRKILRNNLLHVMLSFHSPSHLSLSIINIVVNPLTSVVFSDVDECFQDAYPCHPFAECLNTVGAFVCSCANGFSGNGEFCTGSENAVTF